MELPPNYSLEQMGVLVRGAVMPGVLVAIARDSGKRGTQSEFSAIADGLDRAVKQLPNNSVMRALGSDYGRAEAQKLIAQLAQSGQTLNVHQTKLAVLSRAEGLADLLDQKATPDEAREVKNAVLGVCRAVSESASENSAWGRGTQKVSEEEAGVISEIARAMRATVPT